MKELIIGILDFRKRLRPRVLELFQKMAQGQSPDCLFMACSDSRVVPNVFASTNPGNLFVVRNVGNLIPKPNEQDHTTADESEVAAMEFGILQLGVKNIIVCGHSECGAMLGLLSTDDVKHKCDAQCIHVRMPHLSAWLRHGYESLHKFNRMISNGETPTFSKGSGGTEIRAKINKSLSPHNQLSQINVLQQLESLSKYKVVRDKLENKEIELHGWWFDIANADVYSFSAKKGEFVILDDKKAQELLVRFNIEHEKEPSNNAWPYWVPHKL